MSAVEDLAGGDVGPDAETLRYWAIDIKTSMLNMFTTLFQLVFFYYVIKDLFQEQQQQVS